MKITSLRLSCVLIVMLSTCQLGKSQGRQVNIVYLLADDLGMPDLGAYGNTAIKTPNIDKMAKAGMLFTNAYVVSSQCSPSRASMLLGRSPHAVGASRLHEDALHEIPSVVQLLKKAGYFTGAYRKVHQTFIESQFDFKGDKDLEAFFKKLPAGKPFFMWFGSHDPHRPYFPGTYEYAHDPDKVLVPDYLPDTKAVREDLANYYNEIHRFDRECGEILALLDKYKLTDNTMVIVTSDNGKPFPRAKATCYQAGVNMPFIVKWPGKVKPGSVNHDLITMMDLAPTWLDMAGVKPTPEMEGTSLVNQLEGKPAEKQRDYVFCERNWHDNWDPMRAVVSKRYKLIVNYRPEAPLLNTLDRVYSPSWDEFTRLNKMGKLNNKLQYFFAAHKPVYEFYDLQNDPGEWHNLANDPKYQSTIADFKRALGKWMNDTHDFLPPQGMSFPPKSKFDEKYDPLNAEKLKH